MLRKLLKYEIKATGRTFIPLYLVLIVFGVLNRIFVSPDNFGVPFAITMSLYTIILVGTFVITFVVMIQRFYKNLLNDEGYLMFTLPVETWKHIVCKLLVSMMWTISSFIAAVVSILILAMKEIPWSAVSDGISVILEELYRVFGTSSALLITLIILTMIVSLACGILMIYASIAIGHLFNSHRVLASVGAYFSIYAIVQILITTAMFFMFGNDMLGSEIPTPEVPSFVNGILTSSLITSTVLAGVYFITTNVILNRKLNLE